MVLCCLSGSIFPLDYICLTLDPCEHIMNRMHVATFALSILLSSPALAERVGADSSEQGRIKIKIDGQTVAEYVFQDDEISRPYFASVKSPSGLQVTRNRHPVKGTDLTDHPEVSSGRLDDVWRYQ